MIKLPKKSRRLLQVAVLVVLVVGLGYVVHSGRAATLVGDINNDGVVNVFDMSILLSDWGTATAAADLNHDGAVNVFDLSMLLSNWGHTSSTPTPTPTPSPSGTPVSLSCTNPQFTSSDPEGTWNSPDGYLVQNDMWNGDSQIAPNHQTINACASNNFNAVANMTNQGGEVKTYPDVGALYNSSPKALSTYHTITSTFGESIPALGEWDAAYDIWTNNWSNELMIWNNTHEHPEIPPAGSTAVTIDGVAYHEWHDGTDYIAFMRDSPVDSGSVNILDVYKWLETQGLASPTDTLIELEYGVEISATESSPGVQGPETFQINGWSLTAN